MCCTTEMHSSGTRWSKQSFSQSKEEKSLIHLYCINRETLDFVGDTLPHLGKSKEIVNKGNGMAN